MSGQFDEELQSACRRDSAREASENLQKFFGGVYAGIGPKGAIRVIGSFRRLLDELEELYLSEASK